MVIAGSPGVGKTRLALEGLAAAKRAGRVTASVTASRSASTLPFGALAPLLPAITPESIRIPADEREWLRWHGMALADLGRPGLLLLLVDDAHLLDDASATLVHQSVRARTVQVVVTVRSGEPAPDPIVALWKDGHADRIEVAGLSAAASEDLLVVVLGGPIDRASAAQLSARVQGNVLFLRELVLGALDDGTLRDDGGIWRLVGPLQPSDRLIELVQTRLSHLPAKARSLVELIAVGEPLGQAELAALADPELVQTLELGGVLASRTVGRRLEVRLAHPIYGDVLRAQISSLRLRAMQQRLAGALQATGARRRDDNVRRASWCLTGGGGDPDLLLRAADTARWAYDFALAERLARAAVEEGAGFEAALLAAQTAGLQGHGARAEEDLAALAAAATDDAQRCRVAHIHLDALMFDPARLGESLELAERAEASIGDAALRDEITARRSALTLAAEGPRAAVDAARPLLYRVSGSTLVWAAMVASYSESRLGRLTEARRIIDLGHRTNQELSEPIEWYPWIFHILRCEVLTAGGELQEAEALATAEYDDGIIDQSAEAQAWFAWQLCKILRERGRVQSAARYGYEAVALYRQLARPTGIIDGLAALSLALSHGGRHDESASMAPADCDRALATSAHVAVDRHRAQAWTLVIRQPTDARRILNEAATLGEAAGDLIGATAALHDLARIGFPKDSVRRLAEIAPELEGRFIGIRVHHAEALVDGDPDALSQVADQFAGIGADLLAAEAAADAAVAWRRMGDKRAGAAAFRATSLSERCEGASTPSLLSIDARARLTRAERNTAFLAAAGRSSKQIAEEAGVSVRTVDNHLQRVYEKLGIRSRDELADVIEWSSPPADRS